MWPALEGPARLSGNVAKPVVEDGMSWVNSLTAQEHGYLLFGVKISDPYSLAVVCIVFLCDAFQCSPWYGSDYNDLRKSWMCFLLILATTLAAFVYSEGFCCALM